MSLKKGTEEGCKMAYSELIKNFEKIRSYMRDFYVYGFRTRTDFDRKSARSYDNERRRIESWLGDAMSFRQDASGKRIFISVDSRETPHNPLYRALKARSFTDKDITLHFYILDILADGEKLACKTITERISECCRDIAGASFFPDDSTIRNKLKEYVSLGILNTEKQGREILYFRDDLTWDMDSWKEALSFASEAMPLGAVGSFLLDKYQELPDYFSFKHHYLQGAMDSEILADLLLCRKEKKSALITFSARRSRDGIHQALVYPLKVYISTDSGRENLLAYSFHARRPRMYRLDRIRAVRIMDAQPETEKPEQAGEHFAEHLWGTSGGSGHERNIQTLTMRIRADKDERFAAKRLYREKRNGTVVRLNENTWQFSIKVYDAMEMLPWIRTFTGRIESLACTEPEVTKRFYADLKEMYSIYGGYDDAVQ